MKNLLKKYFGYNCFYPLQEKIINNVIKNKDCLVLMPTGGGKSLCYQLPALKFNGLTLVISPLISLMKDQVDKLQSWGIKADFINSSLSQKEIEEKYEKIIKKQIIILYVAPERFSSKQFQKFITNLEISLIAIDEAHCISEWGHDFRPSYRNLSILKEIFPSTPLIALTATATIKVREDIVTQLKLKEPKVFLSSFNRKNLKIKILEKKRSIDKIIKLLKKYRNESVIIYCFSRNDTEVIASELREEGFKAIAYHAGIGTKKREKAQELFINNEINIIVATIAFGMGIDKSDIRLVIHHTCPKSIENYYQEIGRAGRDGKTSECIMFYNYSDTKKHEFFINKIESYHLQLLIREKLDKVVEFAQLQICRKRFLLDYFGEDLKENNCQGCDICQPPKKRIIKRVSKKEYLIWK